MPQTLVISDPAARRFDVFQQALVRSWKDCGSDVAWVQVVGELDIVTAPALEQTLRDAELRAPLVVLDLRELTFTDSSGVRVIASASARADRAGRRLVLVRGPAQVDRMLALITSDVLEIVGLDPGEPVAHALAQLAPRHHTASTRESCVRGVRAPRRASRPALQGRASRPGSRTGAAPSLIRASAIVRCVLPDAAKRGKPPRPRPLCREMHDSHAFRGKVPLHREVCHVL